LTLLSVSVYFEFYTSNDHFHLFPLYIITYIYYLDMIPLCMPMYGSARMCVLFESHGHIHRQHMSMNHFS
uniref:Ovule protein n=1 Tax=Hydatigena taeniaeformis TaxID=6205 RepID=A0A0R3WKB7_HYDTA